MVGRWLQRARLMVRNLKVSSKRGPDRSTCHAATGKAVSEPVRVIDDGMTDPPGPNHAEFSADGNHLLLGSSGGSEKPDVTQSLQLRPPTSVIPLLPDLGEALGGFRLKTDGSLEAISGSPTELIEKVKSEMAKP